MVASSIGSLVYRKVANQRTLTEGKKEMSNVLGVVHPPADDVQGCYMVLLVQHARKVLADVLGELATPKCMYECISGLAFDCIQDDALEACIGNAGPDLVRIRTRMAGMYGIALVNLDQLDSGELTETNAFVRMGMSDDLQQRVRENNLTIGDILDQAPYLILGRLA